MIGPVVIVGHSYGGSLITEAGNHPKVAELVYIAAFADKAWFMASSQVPISTDSFTHKVTTPAPLGQSFRGYDRPLSGRQFDTVDDRTWAGSRPAAEKAFIARRG
jgi:pimeloyl-ACP methyl ester carboxylesterase